jgi:hypothetical protein
VTDVEADDGVQVVRRHHRGRSRTARDNVARLLAVPRGREDDVAVTSGRPDVIVRRDVDALLGSRIPRVATYLSVERVARSWSCTAYNRRKRRRTGERSSRRGRARSAQEYEPDQWQG